MVAHPLDVSVGLAAVFWNNFRTCYRLVLFLVAAGIHGTQREVCEEVDKASLEEKSRLDSLYMRWPVRSQPRRVERHGVQKKIHTFPSQLTTLCVDGNGVMT